MELGQTVDCRRQQVGPGVLEVIPAGIVGGVLEAEVGAQVEDRRAALNERRDAFDRRTVGQSQEDGVRLRDGLVEGQACGGEMGVDGLNGLGDSPSPGETDQLHSWMPSQDADQLGSGVASCANDRDTNALIRRALPAIRPDRAFRRFEARAHRRTRPLAGGRLATESKPGRIAVMTA